MTRQAAAAGGHRTKGNSRLNQAEDRRKPRACRRAGLAVLAVLAGILLWPAGLGGRLCRDDPDVGRCQRR